MSMPPPRPLARGRSSASLHQEGKKRPPRQFTAGGARIHNRSSSYGQLNKLNKLTRITSLESAENAANSNVAGENRPHINRSKSSDGLLLAHGRNRSNRSLIKLAGLQPLTRTVSNQSTKNMGNSKTINDKVMFGAEADGITAGSDSEEEVDSFDNDVKVIENNNGNTGNEVLNNIIPQNDRSAHETVQPNNEVDESMPKYFGNILSQSTGMERTIATSDSMANSLIDPMNHGKGNIRLDQHQNQNAPLKNANNFGPKNPLNQIPEDRTISAGKPTNNQYGQSQLYAQPPSMVNSSSSLIFQPSSTNIAGYYNQQQQVPNSIGHSSPKSTRNNKLTGNKTANSSLYSSPNQELNNFQDYLNKTPEIETRTQQKLWLQRENSILDLTQSSKNYRLNNAQNRTEFEKFSREYLNVRRYVNPVAESLKRIETIENGGMKRSDTSNTENGVNNSRNITNFKEFASKIADDIKETQTHLNDLWNTAWAENSPLLIQNFKNNGYQPKKNTRQPIQNMTPLSVHINSSTAPNSVLRSPRAPITRTLARNSSSNNNNNTDDANQTSNNHDSDPSSNTDRDKVISDQ
ncbi:hypothetical protein PACTADRAFT_1889 [Pachysolen tannophilus NRRL Y-2460]|uniref:Uncharacterized protein n=1 Tax=Pachysolen tannophilus NRRL Y-2460 TaxID=669874 RepID=A0A1E4U005_PACTA|nr:hypothetical protein PACTADRAFT_1889 [Pachysolen tannophilus NRRL Y-2460]